MFACPVSNADEAREEVEEDRDCSLMAGQRFES